LQLTDDSLAAVLNTEQHISPDVVKKAMFGNEQAKAALYFHYSAAMYNICIRMAGNKRDAEDILQESFVAAFNSLQQLKDLERFGGWIKKITIGQCIAFNRKRATWKELSENEGAAEDDPEPQWYLEFELPEIHEAIKRLPDGSRQVFTLYALEDKSHKEIAELMGMSVSTSKSQYHRAKALLRKDLESKRKSNG
jgi:RNA polymerase sigma-70 factor (ECF subfamily)